MNKDLIDILNEREREVLKYVVENFILNASPVGSRNVSKQTDLNLSAATIRNVMSDLEEMDLLTTPHISAGRIPTDKAYRFYVNSLMNKKKLTLKEEDYLKEQIGDLSQGLSESDDLYIETSKILGKISHLLAVVSQPLLSNGIFERLELVSLSSNKILVVINIRSGRVKTVILEVDSELTRTRLDFITAILNEKLAGLSLKQIKETFKERISDSAQQDPELIQLFFNTFDKIYNENAETGKVYFGGAGEIILQPEFDNPKNFKNLIELTEDKNFVLHIFKNAGFMDDEIQITIGKENTQDKLKDYSLIKTTYTYGNLKGNIGVIGPKRMNYSKIVTLLEYTSRLINEYGN
jgi:heat-inducible transcriptional repressor